MPRTSNLDAKASLSYKFDSSGSVSNAEKKARCKNTTRATCRGCSVAKRALSTKPAIRPEKPKTGTRTHEQGRNGIIKPASAKQRYKANANNAAMDLGNALIAAGL